MATYRILVLRAEDPIGILQPLGIVPHELLHQEVPDALYVLVAALSLSQAPQEGTVEGDKFVQAGKYSLDP